MCLFSLTLSTVDVLVSSSVFPLSRGSETEVFLSFAILQKKAQTQQVREFHTKSIKEKAVHLRRLFSEDSSDVLKVTFLSLIKPTFVLSTVCP